MDHTIPQNNNNKQKHRGEPWPSTREWSANYNKGEHRLILIVYNWKPLYAEGHFRKCKGDPQNRRIVPNQAQKFLTLT